MEKRENTRIFTRQRAGNKEELVALAFGVFSIPQKASVKEETRQKTN